MPVPTQSICICKINIEFPVGETFFWDQSCTCINTIQSTSTMIEEVAHKTYY